MIRRYPVVTLLAVCALAFLWVPLVVVAVNSLNRDELLVRWGGATLDWYQRAVSNELVQNGLVSSFKVAIGTTVLSVVLATTGVLWWRGASTRGRRLFDLLVYSRIILPEVVFATALFLLLTRLDFGLGITAMIIGHSVWGAAFATVVVQARARLLDRTLEQAAADLGATPWRVFRRITLPFLFPGILAAAALTFAISFDDVVTSFFLAGRADSPFPLVVFGLIRFRLSPEVNAIAMLGTTLSVTAVIVAFWLLTRARRGHRMVAPRALAASVER
jgi:ABC-type spermidine/putrescine transport system permease subunit II